MVRYIVVRAEREPMFSASTEILLDMVGRLNHPRVALVHQMPYTTDQAGLAAAVEKVRPRAVRRNIKTLYDYYTQGRIE